MKRTLTQPEKSFLRRVIQVLEERKFPDYHIAVAIRSTTDVHGWPVARISRSLRTQHAA